eukprot:TRINITY_DN27587_c0_g1_i1.p1 TRINITY_DN27587_c0_g1~~TRINITY_DN27587_c0_g1_i1.p1  ORF type:complete len:669 (-),score=31.54 TRINITY_DN27587_c0_g1_i1:210-2216(-)
MASSALGVQMAVESRRTSAASSVSSSSAKSYPGFRSQATYLTRQTSYTSDMVRIASLNHVFCSETTPCLSEMLQRFRTSRSQNRTESYRRILLIAGVALQVVCAIDIVYKVIDNLFGWNLIEAIVALNCLVAMLKTSFLVVVALFAIVLVDFNSFMEEEAKMRWWCLLCLYLVTCAQCSQPPYLGLLGGLAVLISNRWLQGDRFCLLMLSVWLWDAVAQFSYIGAALTHLEFEYSIYWYTYAGISALATLLWLLWHLVFRRGRIVDDGCTSSNLLYTIVIQYLLIMGINCVCFSGLLFCESNLVTESAREVYFGAILLMFPVVLWIVGTERLYLQAAIRFGLLDQLSQERDGAFLASIMDVTAIDVGKTWWVHRPHGEENVAYPKGDHRRNWRIGKIVDVQDTQFVVRVGSVEYSLDLLRRNVTSEDILILAKTNLRCLDWRHFTIDVLKGDLVDRRGITSSTFNSFARPLHDDEERIDFFISHSWYDDAESKYEQLQQIVTEFIQQHGREPTFWLDHVCIDQSNIIDGLRTLPVNILSCSKLIVLCGTTYLSRLWCAWELCSRISFDPSEVAQSTIIIRPLGGIHVADVRARFSAFDILKAECYDPNEQARILSVVRAFGPARFNSMVKKLGSINCRSPRRLTLSSLSVESATESTTGTLPQFPISL